MALLSLRYQEWCNKLSSLPYYVIACKFLKVEMINCQIVYNLFFACNLIETALKCITLNGLILQSTGWKDPSIFYNISLNLSFALKELPCDLHDNWPIDSPPSCPGLHVYASLAWMHIIIWKPYRPIIILLTNYRTRR